MIARVCVKSTLLTIDKRGYSILEQSISNEYTKKMPSVIMKI